MKILRKIFSSPKRIAITILLLVVIGLVLRNYVFNPKEEVETATVKKGDVTEELILSGQVDADEHAKLTFQTSGELAYLGVKEGQYVKKGEVLARLDTTILYQNYLQAQADLRHYQASLNNTYDQIKGHEKDESFTRIELRTVAEVNKDKAYRAFVAASENLSNATLKAPFDGVITSLTYPFTGVNTLFSQPQMEIVNPQTIYFDVSADQTEIIEVTEGQKVLITLDPYSEEVLEGVVGFVGLTPREGEVGAVYTIKVFLLDKKDDLAKLKLGMTGDAKFVISEKHDSLYVPSSFIKADANGRFLNVGKPNNKVYVTVGLEGEDRVEIKEGEVKEGDIVFD